MFDPASIPDDFDTPAPAPPRALPEPHAALTYRQEQVWRAMLDYQDTHGGRPPSHKALSAAVGMKSSQGCLSHFPTLSRLGFIVRLGGYGCWRSWRAVETPVPPTDLSQVYGAHYGRHNKRRGRPPLAVAAALPPIAPPSDPSLAAYGPTEAEGFTRRQVEVWHTFFRLQHDNGGVPPTQKQVSEALGLSSIQGARAHFGALAAGGYMKHRFRVWLAVVPAHKYAPTPEPAPEPAAPLIPET